MTSQIVRIWTVIIAGHWRERVNTGAGVDCQQRIEVAA